MERGEHGGGVNGSCTARTTVVRLGPHASTPLDRTLCGLRSQSGGDGPEPGGGVAVSAVELAAERRGADSGAAGAAGVGAATEAGGVGARGYRLELPVFEGPLDLLLHLIQQHELDVFDIPVAFVTEKYLEYLRLMEVLDIDIASEYLVMAATLAHIKSRTLLPAAPAEDEGANAGEDEEDPRAELVRRLLEYQRYKEVASRLGERALLGRDVFERGAPTPEVEGPAPLAPHAVFKLLEAFRVLLLRAERNVEHEILAERISIAERINEVSALLGAGRLVPFEELFAGKPTRADLVVTFLALLEMTRLRLIHVEQAGPLEPIRLGLAVTEGETAQGSVEEAGGAGEGAPGLGAVEAESQDAERERLVTEAREARRLAKRADRRARKDAAAKGGAS